MDHTINVYHIYARQYNFGDYALGVGLRNIFLRYFKPNILFKPIDIHTLEFDRQFIDKVNKDADLVVVGGGGLIHGFAGDRWMLNLPSELIPEIKVPMLFYGLGYNQFRGEAELSEEIITNLRLLKEKALAFSVRNDKSKEELLRLGLEFDQVPDSGFFVNENIPSRPIKEKYVIIQLAYDMKERRSIQDNSIIEHFAEISKFLLLRGYKVVFCPHVRKDSEISDRIIKRVNRPDQVFSWDWYQMIREANTSLGLSYYKHAEFTISMRGHAQICPIGLGTPVISVISHRKNIDLLKELELEKYSVEIGDIELSQKIKLLVEDVERNREEIKARYQTINEELTKQAQEYLEELSKKFPWPKTSS